MMGQHSFEEDRSDRGFERSTTLTGEMMEEKNAAIPLRADSYDENNTVKVEYLNNEVNERSRNSKRDREGSYAGG